MVSLAQPGAPIFDPDQGCPLVADTRWPRRLHEQGLLYQPETANANA
jgi:hypothetical protein